MMNRNNMFLWLSTKICFILSYAMGPSLCLEMNWPNLKTSDITAVRLGAVLRLSQNKNLQQAITVKSSPQTFPEPKLCGLLGN